MKRPISFTIHTKIPGTLGRSGTLSTPHGDIETPSFVVVGTKATVKALTPQQLKQCGVQTVLANTYHLFLQPGSEVVRDAGGLHTFMNYNGPMWTDSGGFQIFSLGEGLEKQVSKFEKENKEDITLYNKELATEHGKLAIVDDEGVTFTSHIDGSMHRFTAERSIEIQHNLGADIIFSFDECTSPTADKEYQKEAMDRTHEWARRGLKAHRENTEANNKQGLFGIVQGGRFQDLRKESAQILANMDFDGYGIGGSFSKKDLDVALEVVVKELPEDKPRHLLGIGEVEDIFVGIENGMDTFDCVLPTRLARTGTLYTREGKVNITKAEYKDDMTLLSEYSDVFKGETYTRSYLHHLFKANEILASTLASMNNIAFFSTLFEEIREAIKEGRFDEYRKEFLASFSA